MTPATKQRQRHSTRKSLAHYASLQLHTSQQNYGSGIAMSPPEEVPRTSCSLPARGATTNHPCPAQPLLAARLPPCSSPRHAPHTSSRRTIMNRTQSINFLCLLQAYIQTASLPPMNTRPLFFYPSTPSSTLLLSCLA